MYIYYKNDINDRYYTIFNQAEKMKTLYYRVPIEIKNFKQIRNQADFFLNYKLEIQYVQAPKQNVDQKIQDRNLKKFYRVSRIDCQKMKDKYISLTCRTKYCRWQFRYLGIKQNGIHKYKLRYFWNIHNHIVLRDITKQREFQALNRFQYLKNHGYSRYLHYLDLCHNDREIKKLKKAFHNFNYNYNGQSNVSNQRLISLIQALDKNKEQIIFCSHPDARQSYQVPDFFFVTSKRCRNAYQSKKQILFVYNLRNTSHNSKNVFVKIDNFMEIIIFFGILPNQNMIIYAVAAFTIDQKNSFKNLSKPTNGFYKALRLFFSIMGTCFTLVSDSSTRTNQAIKYYLQKTMSAQIDHIINPFEYVRQFSSIFQEGALKVLIAQDQIQYEAEKCKWLTNFSHQNQQQLFMAEQFLNYYQNTSIFLRKKPIFLGNILAYHPQIFDKVNQYFRVKFQRKNSFEPILIKFLISNKLDERRHSEHKSMKMINLTNSTCQGFYHSFAKTFYPIQMGNYISEDVQILEQLQYIRCNYYKEAFTIFINQYSMVGYTDVVNIKIDEEGITTTTFQDMNGSLFYCYQQAIVDQNSCQFVCSCNKTLILGIPCRHILKSHGQITKVIRNYLSNYWKTSYSKEQIEALYWKERNEEIPKVGRPLKTKRRTMNKC